MENKEKTYRVNDQIKFSPVVVITPEGKNLGSIPLQKAKDIAQQIGLDLVEIAPSSRPPVCKIIDYGKFRFEQNKKQKKSQIKQVKEIRLSPSIQENDILTKVKSAIKFLKLQHKVNIKLEFKRREINHQNIGMEVINNFIERIKEYGSPVSRPKSEGRSLFCVIEPKQ